MDLNAAMVFVRVVRLGSFTRAAQELNLPNSTVSDRVSELERQLGVSLLVRTTRKLHLTDAGSAFFEKAESALNSLWEAEEEASAFQKAPLGLLKITASADFNQQTMWGAIVEYREKFPAVRVEAHFTDRVVDLVGEGFDLAIRAGELKDSSLMAKLVGSSGLVLVAGRGYLNRKGPIRRPQDLLAHPCIRFVSDNNSKYLAVWELVAPGGKVARIEPSADLTSNSMSAIWQLVALDQGIALLPEVMVCDEASRAVMARVLPEWSTLPVPTHLVYPAFRISSAKVREMLHILEPRLRALLQPSP